MKKSIALIRWLVVGMALLLMVPLTVAQRGETFVSPDEDWQVTLPRGYEIEVERDGVALITSDDAEIELYSPLVLEDLGFTRIRDGQDLIEMFAEEERFEFVELDTAENVPGLYVGLLQSSRDSLIGISKEFSDGSFGFAVIALSASADDDVILETIEIVQTFDVPDSSSNGGGTKDPGTNASGGTDAVDSLRDFDADWEDAVAELEDAEMIAPGGTLVFFEDSAFIAGSGGNYTSLARRASVQNIVMAGELTFEPDGRDYQTCSMAARVVQNSDGSTNVFTEIGVNSDGVLYVYDAFGTDEGEAAFYDLASVDHEEVHHYLAIIVEDSLTLYFDGELVATDVEVVARDGSFGVLLRGDGSNSRCEIRNSWAYTIPSGTDVCSATSAGDINKRSGPGTNFDRAGQLRGGRPTEVIAFANGRDGFVWYELEDETWVREDLITLSGPCNDLPED